MVYAGSKIVKRKIEMHLTRVASSLYSAPATKRPDALQVRSILNFRCTSASLEDTEKGVKGQVSINPTENLIKPPRRKTGSPERVELRTKLGS